MEQNLKELLLRDLCARLPYMPKIKITYQQQGIKGTDEGNVSCDFIEKIVNDLRNGVITDMQIFLRPMSSMTEDENKERKQLGILCVINGNHERIFDGFGNESADTQLKALDWLNAHHFDYRGLIEKNLALDCTGFHIYD